jgi:hypothetical protein
MASTNLDALLEGLTLSDTKKNKPPISVRPRSLERPGPRTRASGTVKNLLKAALSAEKAVAPKTSRRRRTPAKNAVNTLVEALSRQTLAGHPEVAASANKRNTVKTLVEALTKQTLAEPAPKQTAAPPRVSPPAKANQSNTVKHLVEALAKQTLAEPAPQRKHTNAALENLTKAISRLSVANKPKRATARKRKGSAIPEPTRKRARLAEPEPVAPASAPKKAKRRRRGFRLTYRKYYWKKKKAEESAK